VLPQICTGDVNVTSNISADIYLADTTGFYAGMSVYLTGFSGSAGSDLNGQVWQLSAVASDHITVIGSGGSFNTTGSFTGQSGTVYQNVTIEGFTGALAVANDSVAARVTAIGSGTVSIDVGGAIASGPYTGQSAGVVGLPVCPNWYWNYAGITNEAGLGMVIFPGNSGGTGPGGLETKLFGTITKIADIDRVHVEFEVSDPMFRLNMRIPRRLMQPNCPWNVTDQNCTLNAAGTDINGNHMTQAFTLASGTQYVLFPATPFAQPEGYFTQGVVTCTSGNNNGLSQTVKLHANGELTLMNPWLLPVEPGDTFSVLVGCDHTPTTCQNKFGNRINFGGTPFVPPETAAV
jgi:hypothetical protein